MHMLHLSCLYATCGSIQVLAVTAGSSGVASHARLVTEVTNGMLAPDTYDSSTAEIHAKDPEAVQTPPL